MDIEVSAIYKSETWIYSNSSLAFLPRPTQSHSARAGCSWLQVSHVSPFCCAGSCSFDCCPFARIVKCLLSEVQAATSPCFYDRETRAENFGIYWNSQSEWTVFQVALWFCKVCECVCRCVDSLIFRWECFSLIVVCSVCLQTNSCSASLSTRQPVFGYDATMFPSDCG